VLCQVSVQWGVAILKITTDLDFLHKKSKPVTVFDARLHALINDMRDTLADAEGAGIAAVQVGVLWRVCLVMTPNGVVEFVNPEILSQRNPKTGKEMCLSLPQVCHRVFRPQLVTVVAKDRNGNDFTIDLEKIGAVCVCHEIDHMDGIVITDHPEGKPK